MRPRLTETLDQHLYFQGQVLKLVSTETKVEGGKSNQPVIIEELQVLPYGQPVLGLQITQKSEAGSKSLLVTSSSSLLSVPLQRCGVAGSCSACLALQDPYCGWDVVSSLCVSHTTFNSLYASEFLQNISFGRHRQCGDSESSVLIEEFKDSSSGLAPGVPSPQSGENILVEHHHRGRYSTEELSMAVATSCVSALILGFVAGFLVARKCQCGSDNPYHVPYLNRSVSLNVSTLRACKTFM